MSGGNKAHNLSENITEHNAFHGGGIVVCAEISLGYHTDLHICRRGSVTAVRYHDDVLDPTVKLHAAVVRPPFVSTDNNACHQRAVVVDD
ncbi:transposable element Tcb1 transposase [Trichonephila clavipes]|nr:transposable element Tcb1 transposase [Trichonephila clavipes]